MCGEKTRKYHATFLLNGIPGPQRIDFHVIPHILAFRLVADTEDEILKMEMDPLVESLTVSGQHVLLATQKLSIQPEVIEHREELIEATQNVLLGVVKVTSFVR